MVKKLRLSILGFGAVGQGLAELVHTKRELLRHEFDLDISLVGVATGRHGFVYCAEGLDIPNLLDLAAQCLPLTHQNGVQHWEDPLQGLLASDSDVMAEVTGTNLRDAEPGISHIRAALSVGMHVVTANKGPAALAAGELFALAQRYSVQLRMESTVMAGTPVLSTIREGMAGVRVQAVRGILNGTTNYILSAMALGRSYAEVLAEAQAHGYAEADPTADVEGYDVVAKTLILAALVFGYPLKPEQVYREGITAVTSEQIQEAQHAGKRIKLVASLTRGINDIPLVARVEPLALPFTDALANLDGTMNAITFYTDSLSSITISGPGAGRLETGQGLLSDIIAISKSI